MTQEDIIKWAHKAAPDMTWYAAIDEPDQASPEELGFLERFAALVAAAEREACARVCDELAERDKLSNYYRIAANAIRARGQQQEDDHDGNPSF
jgi:hypothetical protein